MGRLRCFMGMGFDALELCEGVRSLKGMLGCWWVEVVVFSSIYVRDSLAFLGVRMYLHWNLHCIGINCMG